MPCFRYAYHLNLDSSCARSLCSNSTDVYQPTKPSPPTLVVYGSRATGKSSIVESYLQASKLKHAIVRSQECVTGRHFLERTVSAVYESLHPREDGQTGDYNPRCENLSALVVHLQRLLQKEEKFVLVLDGVDKQREAPPTLLPALARLGEFVLPLPTPESRLN